MNDLSQSPEFVTIPYDSIIFDEGLYPRINGHDPDTLKPIDLRNHHKTNFNQTLQLPFDDEDAMSVVR